MENGFIHLAAKCRSLKLTAADGKQCNTDASDLETLLRLIQSIPSPKAEPIKLWLAKGSAETLEKPTSPANPRVPLLAESAHIPIAVAWAEAKPADGDLLGWAAWLEKLAAVYRQQASVESRVSYMEAGLRSHDQRLEDITLRLD